MLIQNHYHNKYNNNNKYNNYEQYNNSSWSSYMPC